MSSYAWLKGNGFRCARLSFYLFVRMRINIPLVVLVTENDSVNNHTAMLKGAGQADRCVRNRSIHNHTMSPPLLFGGFRGYVNSERRFLSVRILSTRFLGTCHLSTRNLSTPLSVRILSTCYFTYYILPRKDGRKAWWIPCNEDDEQNFWTNAIPVQAAIWVLWSSFKSYIC